MKRTMLAAVALTLTLSASAHDIWRTDEGKLYLLVETSSQEPRRIYFRPDVLAAKYGLAVDFIHIDKAGAVIVVLKRKE